MAAYEPDPPLTANRHETGTQRDGCPTGWVRSRGSHSFASNWNIKTTPVLVVRPSAAALARGENNDANDYPQMMDDPVFLGVILLGLLVAGVQQYMAWSWIWSVRRRTNVRRLEHSEPTLSGGGADQPATDSPTTANQRWDA